MAVVEAGSSLLLALPDPCLLAVLQCCAANDQRSLFSAARAHSRLHQAAVLALRSITAVVTRQEQVDSVLLYLGKHRQHVDSVSIDYTGVDGGPRRLSLCLPVEVATQLRSWQLKSMSLEGGAFRGVLGPTLTQLRLSDCELCDNATGEALAAALPQLVGLEHLSLRGLFRDGAYFVFPVARLQQQQLTYLELEELHILASGVERPALQPLQALTRLVDLRLKRVAAQGGITAGVLSGAQHLSRMELFRCGVVQPAALAGKTRLQHLQIASCWVGASHDAAEVAQLMSHLQHLQQLTHLDLAATFWDVDEDQQPPAAAYAALTASSRLQHLDISQCRLPAAAWQHVFPAGRQLPQLWELNITELEEPSGMYGTAPEGTRLVSCCPGLQSLDMRRMPYSTELLAALQGLSGLHTLHLDDSESAQEGGLQGVCHLTGLRELSLGLLQDRCDEGLLLRLTQLQQLTSLKYYLDGSVRLASKAPGDEPVWRQLLRRHLDSSDPDVAQQAAAGLAASHSE